MEEDTAFARECWFVKISSLLPPDTQPIFLQYSCFLWLTSHILFSLQIYSSYQHYSFIFSFPFHFTPYLYTLSLIIIPVCLLSGFFSFFFTSLLTSNLRTLGSKPWPGNGQGESPCVISDYNIGTLRRGWGVLSSHSPPAGWQRIKPPLYTDNNTDCSVSDEVSIVILYK